jgi:hypothetical protein
VLTCFNGPIRAIQRIYWTRFQQRNLLITLGGTQEQAEPSGYATMIHATIVLGEMSIDIALPSLCLHLSLFASVCRCLCVTPTSILIRYLKEVTFLSPPLKAKYNLSSRTASATNELNANEIHSEFVDSALVFASPYLDATDPMSLIALSSDAQLAAYHISPGGVFPPIAVPPNMLIQHSAISSSQHCLISTDFAQHLASLAFASSPGRTQQYWPINGGQLRGGEHIEQHQILITGHENGNVYFWDLSRVNMMLLYTIKVTSEQPPPEDAAVVSLNLCVDSRILAVACRSGEALVYYFNITPRRFHVQSFPDIDQRKAATAATVTPSAPPEQPLSAPTLVVSPRKPLPPTPTLAADATTASAVPIAAIIEPIPATPAPNAPNSPDSPAAPAAAAAPAASEVAALATMPAPIPPTPPPDEGQPFSWLQFFVAAGIGAQQAQAYHDLFERHRITEDLLSELDNDMMQMAGISAIGDRLRVRAYIKNYDKIKEAQKQYRLEYPALVKAYQEQLAAYQQSLQIPGAQQSSTTATTPSAATLSTASNSSTTEPPPPPPPQPEEQQPEPPNDPIQHRPAPAPPLDFVPPTQSPIPPQSHQIDPPEDSIPEHAPGYQLNIRHSLPRPITRITISSSLHMYATITCSHA